MTQKFPFVVAESCKKRYWGGREIGVNGMRGPTACREYGGSSMFKLSEAYPLFGNKENWAKYKEVLMEACPFWTYTLIGFSRKPLGESIQKADGSSEFCLASTSGGISEKLFLPDDFLSQNENKSGIVIVEENISVNKRGDNDFSYSICYPSDLRFMPIPSGDLKNTSDYPSLFGNIENLPVRLLLPSADVRVGFVAVGSLSFLTEVQVPGVSCMLGGVLVR